MLLVAVNVNGPSGALRTVKRGGQTNKYYAAYKRSNGQRLDSTENSHTTQTLDKGRKENTDQTLRLLSQGPLEELKTGIV